MAYRLYWASNSSRLTSCSPPPQPGSATSRRPCSRRSSSTHGLRLCSSRITGSTRSGIVSNSISASRVDKPACAAASPSCGNVRRCGSPFRTPVGIGRCHTRLSSNRQPSSGSSAPVRRSLPAGGSRWLAMASHWELPGHTMGVVQGGATRDALGRFWVDLGVGVPTGSGASHNRSSAGSCGPHGFHSPMIPPGFSGVAVSCKRSALGHPFPSFRQGTSRLIRL